MWITEKDCLRQIHETQDESIEQMMPILTGWLTNCIKINDYPHTHFDSKRLIAFLHLLHFRRLFEKQLIKQESCSQRERRKQHDDFQQIGKQKGLPKQAFLLGY